MKIKLVLKIVIVFLVVFLISSNIVIASNYNSTNQFDNVSTSGKNVEVIDNSINRVLGIVLSIVRTIAVCIAIIMLMVIGIKYMSCVDPNQKGKLKQQVPNYVTGAILLFAAAAILQLVTVFVNDVI